MNNVLDSNIILIYLRDTQAKQIIENKYQLFGLNSRPIISIVTIGEIFSIAQQNNWGLKKLSAIQDYLKELIVIDIRYNDLLKAYADIDTFSQGKLKSKPLGLPARNMGKNDLWIAATTHVVNARLITTDKDFIHLNKTFFEVIYIDAKDMI